MIHLGDITKIKGCVAPVVDCVIGGSPCQDLSVAGKRAGLAGERSGLYMEQIRIIKEMRYKDEQRGRTGESIRPRYMVWENVPGAFSSNKGQDFAAVLEEAIKVADPEAASVPVPERGWPTSGCFMGDTWSVAWRVLDAQFWGVPQRRRRIALVADFGGQSAPEILFIRKGVSRDLDESEQERKATAGDAKNRIGADDRDGAIGCDIYNLALSGDKAVSLTTAYNSTGSGPSVAIPYTLKIRSGCMGGGKGALIQTDKSATLSTLQDKTLFQPVVESMGHDMRSSKFLKDGKMDTLTSCDYKEPAIVAYPAPITYQKVTGPLMANSHPGSYTGQDAFSDMLVAGVDCRNATEYPEMNATLQRNADHNINSNNVVRVRYIVRRLTPLECERLQGFPDGWTDIGEWVDSKGKKHKEADSPRYKALGNSIAIPPWKWVLKRLCACYERDATMASLFDGIGGFPYIWEQLNGKSSCLWASEIEEFPMAVTKVRFPSD